MVDASEDGAFALDTDRGAKEKTDGQQAARSANADIERIILVLGLCAVGRRRPQVVSQPQVHLVVEGGSFQLQLDAKLNQHPSPPVANPTTSLSTISKITATWVTARTDKRIKRLDWDKHPKRRRNRDGSEWRTRPRQKRYVLHHNTRWQLLSIWGVK